MKDDYRYPYAKTDNEELIGIDKVTKENKKDYHFYCYGCGEELIPVLGEIREHHFRHKKNNVTCDRNVYLHEFAKNVIKERFDKSEHFYVKYKAERICKKKDNCELGKCNWEECYADDLYEIDLKKYYDKCICEKGYYDYTENGKKRYIADLKLVCSEDDTRELGIEIWVTHECSEEKRNGKMRIIEIKIGKEADAFREIVENDTDELPIRFFNFKRNICLEPSKKLLHCIYKNPNYKEEYVSCSDGINFDEENEYEVYIDSEKLNDEDELILKSILFSNRGLPIRNCLICANVDYRPLFKRTFCKVGNGDIDNCFKNKLFYNCQYYKYSSNKGDHEKRKFEKLYWENKSVDD